MKTNICIFLAALLLLTGCDTNNPCQEGHTWSSATCEAPKTCLACNTTEGEAVEHTYDEYIVIVEPTCAENGKEEAVCIWCEMKIQREIPKLEHSTEWEITTPATSTSEGLKSLKCQICGEITSTEKIPSILISSVQTTDKSIGTAYDCVRSAKNDISKADRIFTNIRTICISGQVDDTTYAYYDEAINLIKSAKTKLKSANDIFSNHNSSYRFQIVLNNILSALQQIDMFILAETTPYSKESLNGCAGGNLASINIIKDNLYDIIGEMIEMGY